MFIGSAYRLREDREARSPTALGYKKIVIKDRVLSRTEMRFKGGDVEITSYYYTLMCLVNDGDSAEISEDELQSEVIAGLYEFIYP
tara:strand:+ start:442 stop:699 length:258 start_codon:yes stop_codon:yes gene_type:complete